MDPVVKKLSPIFLGLCLCGCQIPYLLKSGINQVSLLGARVDNDQALTDPKLSDNEKHKILLAKKVKNFMVETLKLKENRSYTSYVKLDRTSLSYVVNAAEKWQLKSHQWWFPILGQVPYKGFFSENEAKTEELELQKQDLDTYLRGVSAFSSLGWFNDPIYSSMTAGKDHDFVNTLIHETVHLTLYIKSSADFNERMAVFLGNKGTELFYLQQEGENSPTLKEIRLENSDEKLFSIFIGREIQQLEKWYKEQTEKSEENRQSRLAEINQRFRLEVEPKLQSLAYQKFATAQLNNAKLTLYRTYMQDLSDFAELYDLSNNDFSVFLSYCQELEKEPKPAEGLKSLILKIKASNKS